MSETRKPPAAVAPRREDSRPLKEVAKLGDLFSNAEFLRRMQNAVPSVITPTMMLSSLAGSLRKSPELGQCSVADVAGKILLLAQAGLPPDTPLQLAHLIPFKEKRWNPATRQQEEHYVCQMVLGYHGLLDLAFRSGKIASVIGHVAWRDEVDARAFQYEFGTEEHLRHTPLGNFHDISPEAQAAGTAEFPAFAYAVATLVEGKAKPFEVMPWPLVARIRDTTPAYRFARFVLEDAQKQGRRPPPGFLKAPWVAFVEKMAAKTVAKQLLNWLPRSVEYASIAALDDMQDRRPVDLGPIIDSSDYVAAAMDAAEASGDAGATFGTREQAGTQQQRAPESEPRQPERQPARQAAPQHQTRPRQERQQPTQAEPQPGRWGAPEGQQSGQEEPPPAAGAVGGERGGADPDAPPPALTAAAEPADFEAYLLDEQGQIAADAIADPVQFALAVADFAARAADDEEWDATAFLENNADAMQIAREMSPGAEEILDRLETGLASRGAAEDFPRFTVMEDRGRKDWTGFIRNVKVAVAGLDVATLHPWTAHHLPLLADAPATPRIQFAAEVSARAAQLQCIPPPGLAAIVPSARAAPAPAPPAPAPTSPAAAASMNLDEGPAAPPSRYVHAEADGRLVDSWAKEIKAQQTVAQVRTWQATTFVSRALERLEKETKPQYDRAVALIEQRIQELRPPA